MPSEVFFQERFGFEWSQTFSSIGRDRSRRAEQDSLFSDSISLSHAEKKCKFQDDRYSSIHVCKTIGWQNKPIRIFYYDWMNSQTDILIQLYLECGFIKMVCFTGINSIHFHREFTSHVCMLWHLPIKTSAAMGLAFVKKPMGFVH